MIPEKYRAILYLPHYQSKTRPKMDRIDRAAQFSPFSALVGYEDIIEETNRLTEQEIDYGEESKIILDRKLAAIERNVAAQPEISVTYFIADKKKEGGVYKTEKKKVKRIDYTLRIIHFTDKTSLPFRIISDFDGEIFDEDP